MREPHLVDDGFDLDHWKEGVYRHIRERDFSLWLHRWHGFDDDDYSSALVVTKSGERYWAKFVLPGFLAREMAQTQDERRYAGGRYYWESGIVVVRDFAEETLLAVIADLINRKQLSKALSAVGEV